MSGKSGFSSQQKQDNKVQNFDSNDTRDTSQFNTLQRNYSDKVAADSLLNGMWKVNLGLLQIADASDPSKRVLTINGHGAKKFDMIRFADNSSLQGFESQIVKIIDTNNVVIATIPPAVPTVGDEVDVLRSVTLRLGADGTIQVSVAPTPIRFVLDGVDTEVEESTTVPADSRPLPIQELSRIVGFDMIDCSTNSIGSTSEALITTPAYVQSLEVINTAGLPFILSIGPQDILVGADGLKRQAIAIPAGTAIEIKTAQASAVADSGVVGINLFA